MQGSRGQQDLNIRRFGKSLTCTLVKGGRLFKLNRGGPLFGTSLFPLLPAVRGFPAVPAAALFVAPVIFFTAIRAPAPVRRGEGFIGYAAVGHPQAAFALSPVVLVPAVRPDPAFSGAAAPVIPADTGAPAAGICTVIHRFAGQQIRTFFLTHGNLETHSRRAAYYGPEYSRSPRIYL
jgi:hypothetical protein